MLLATATARCRVDMEGRFWGQFSGEGVGRGIGIGLRGSDGSEENEGDDETWSN